MLITTVYDVMAFYSFKILIKSHRKYTSKVDNKFIQ